MSGVKIGVFGGSTLGGVITSIGRVYCGWSNNCSIGEGGRL